MTPAIADIKADYGPQHARPHAANLLEAVFNEPFASASTEA
jgi:hypothetical protein